MTTPSFDEMWTQTGYQYGEDPLDNVHYGWELAESRGEETDFDKVWAKTGSRYGAHPLAQVRFGWELRLMAETSGRYVARGSG